MTLEQARKAADFFFRKTALADYPSDLLKTIYNLDQTRMGKKWPLLIFDAITVWILTGESGCEFESSEIERLLNKPEAES